MYVGTDSDSDTKRKIARPTEGGLAVDQHVSPFLGG